jgi:hypothetical protein
MSRHLQGRPPVLRSTRSNHENNSVMLDGVMQAPGRPDEVNRSLHLTPWDGQLVIEDDDLQIGLSHRSLPRQQARGDVAGKEEGADHGGALSQMTV